MTIVLNLTPEAEFRLREKAACLGKTVEEYLGDLIDDSRTGSTLPRTAPEAVDYWEREGVFGSFEDGPDSPELVRQWRDHQQSGFPKL